MRLFMKAKSILLNSFMRLLLCILFVFLCIGCRQQQPMAGNADDEKSQVQSEENEAEEEGEGRLSIDVTVEHTPYPEDFLKYDFCFKLGKQDKSDLWIEPTSRYYDDYISGECMDLDVDWGGDKNEEIRNEYPIIGCHIVNNTDLPLSIDRLELIVSKSEEDPFPYVHIYTSDNLMNSICFTNENWTNWGKATLKYKILKKGEQFDGKYNKKREIPFFEDYYELNLIDDLTEMGYNLEAISKTLGEEKDNIKDGFWVQIPEEKFEEWKNLFSPFEIGVNEIAEEIDENGKTTETFDEEAKYYGFARIYGQLSFSRYPLTVKFKGKIPLSTSGEYGAGNDVDDRFDVTLKPIGTDYVLRFPYVTSIAPGGNERVNLRLKCKRSAIHHFKIKAINSNELDISSKNIHLHYIKPRHSEI